MTIQPTYTGYVSSTEDALILFQATINGKLPAVSRRPQDRERTNLVQSGAVFVFNEHNSGIKRWTDGIAWSPSRILGNFLVYRQLEKPSTPGEKKKPNRFTSSTSSASSPNGGSPHRNSSKRASPYSPSAPDRFNSTVTGAAGFGDEKNNKFPISTLGCVNGSLLPIQITLPDQVHQQRGNTIYTITDNGNELHAERALVGSLVDSYSFKKNGLIKKTMSITVKGQLHHLVSYYNPEDVISGIFDTPSNNVYLKDIEISNEITQNQNFRFPLESGNDVPRNNINKTVPQRQLQNLHQMHQLHHTQSSVNNSELLLPHLSYLTGQPQPVENQPGYDLNYDMRNLRENDLNSTETPSFFRNGQSLANFSSMGPAPVAGYQNYGFHSSSNSQIQQRSQTHFLQPEYYSAVATSPATVGMTGTPDLRYQNDRFSDSSNVYLPSLPPLTQSYSVQGYNNTYSSAGGPNIASSEFSPQMTQQIQQVQPATQQHHMAESDPRRFPESTIVTNSQDLLLRPIVVTVQPPPPLQLQQPVGANFGYSHENNF